MKSIESYTFFDCSGLMRVTIPDGVMSIGNYAFCNCSGLASLTMPGSVTNIAGNAFGGCSGLRSVEIPQYVCSRSFSSVFPSAYQAITNVDISIGATRIVDSAFYDCTSLIKVTVPESVTYVGDDAFAQCSSLQSVVFNGDAPDIGSDIFEGTPKRMVVYVPDNSVGWGGGVTADLPSTFANRAIAHSGDVYDWGSEGVSERTVSMTITNVVVHYVLNSVVPEIAVPISDDTEFVNVITEIRGGAIAIPDSWTANYPSFAEKFGSDISSALTKPTGKRDARGNAMMVWQDYVAGTDPTKEDDVFQASITMVDGIPQIGYTPELSAEEKARRNYVTYGKVRLQDEEWHVVDDDAVNYNFFKVTVEMK